MTVKLHSMKISREHLGFLPDKREVFIYILENKNGISLKISNYGGTIHSMMVPDKSGSPADVLLGYSTWEEWIDNPAYFNCIVGRTCNRIGGARFSIDGEEYQVSANQDKFQLHGGFHGFQHKLWDARTLEQAGETGLELEYVSPDGEEGFPGNLRVRTIFTLNNQNEISIEFQASTDKATPVNLTHHAYFNLGGEGSGNIYSHELLICADTITTTDTNQLPTGELTAIAGTPFDFTAPRKIGEKINQLIKGYDDNYVLRNQANELALAAKVLHHESGRILEVYTTEPGLQLYTSNWFDGSILGKCGKPHLVHSAFCLETQHFPDSMNHPEFPDVILRPGEQFYSKTVWKFSNNHVD